MYANTLLTLPEKMNYRGAKKEKVKEGVSYKVIVYYRGKNNGIYLVIEMGLVSHKFRLHSEDTFQKVAESSMWRDVGKGKIMNDLGLQLEDLLVSGGLDCYRGS